MIAADDLVELVRSYNPRVAESDIRRAYCFGKRMHQGQWRRSGEPYFSHPVEVAVILARQQLDDATIIAALLHDTIEDTRATQAQIVAQFGEKIAMLVDGVTNLTGLQLASTDTRQAENFRKLMMAMSKDVRVILIKLADRLHNMRTLRSLPPQKQIQKANETMDIYAPLAGRMGMQWMREELEDLAFKVLNPKARRAIMRHFIKLRRQHGNLVEIIMADINRELRQVPVEATTTGRVKKPYSIWRKMKVKEQTFRRLSDVYAFRIITETEDDCYRILGAIHRCWRAVPGRFKDYISQPKSNGYRALHTTVIGRDGMVVEIQIRTQQMHQIAETGVAAHWSYRDGERVQNPFSVEPTQWARGLMQEFDAEPDHREFLECAKLEMYPESVFCFTPKGKVIRLRRGATALDFAYAIHSSVGNGCTAAMVNGARAPLGAQLRNGQTVQIITARGQTPQEAWLDMVQTGRARTAIRSALRKQEQQRFAQLGLELMRTALARENLTLTDKLLDTAARCLRVKDRDTLLQRVGQGELPTAQVFRVLYPDLAPPRGEAIPRERAVIEIKPGQQFKRAPCCQPLPGERIIGLKHRSLGIVIHAIGCEALASHANRPEHWQNLHWQPGPHAAIYNVSLAMTISNDAGVLGRICTLIGNTGANISDLVFTDRKPDFYRLLISVELRDATHLHDLMHRVEVDTDVVAIRRHHKAAAKHPHPMRQRQG
ncbi:MAG: bifunctional (p)ppGpp synthetase/guanosine-3',5'-bis(diphosphate) 3'-pyrophosphohydrolase [Rhodobacteraceae bacterium]|nr:bifunctional (p)ppGpp synthetase/guanosine-3',5'-bis(diphosphate) 3'-pyrophosphohydrolase [Paracoccaceae bacterium]